MLLMTLGFGCAEVLQYTGLFNFAEPRWWNVGYAKLRGEDLNYLGLGGFRIAGNQGIAIIAICQVKTDLVSRTSVAQQPPGRACGWSSAEKLLPVIMSSMFELAASQSLVPHISPLRGEGWEIVGGGLQA